VQNKAWGTASPATCALVSSMAVSASTADLLTHLEQAISSPIQEEEEANGGHGAATFGGGVAQRVSAHHSLSYISVHGSLYAVGLSVFLFSQILINMCAFLGLVFAKRRVNGILWYSSFLV